MNSTFTLSTLCLATTLLLGGTGLTPAYADDKSSDWSHANAALSVAQVLQKLDAAGYSHIEKIQLKRGNYEVRTTNRNGERIKLYVNAQTGSILGQRNARNDSQHSGSVMQKLMENCNERRCRDDLGAAPESVPAAKPVSPVKP